MAAVVTPRILLVSEPRLVAGKVTGGITTRLGFPAATRAGNDDPARAEGRSVLARAIKLPNSRMAWPEQVHGSTVRLVGAGGCAGAADALITHEINLALLIAVADCGPVLLWDEVAGIIGAVHAGWRGTVAGICEETLAAMLDSGADQARIRAWIGPCIGAGHFEVGEEVAVRFATEFVNPASEDRTRPHVDLVAAIHQRLRNAGVADTRIRQANQCTFELKDRYWSYRRDGGICGRQFAWIVRSAS